MATKQKASLEAQILSWGSAAGLAALSFVLLIVLGDWGIIQAIWAAAVIFLVLGAFNYFVFARPTPPLAGSFPPDMASGTARKLPESVKRGPTEAPAPTSPESSELPASAVAAAAPQARTAEPAKAEPAKAEPAKAEKAPEPARKPAPAAKPAGEGDKTE